MDPPLDIDLHEALGAQMAVDLAQEQLQQSLTESFRSNAPTGIDTPLGSASAPGFSISSGAATPHQPSKEFKAVLYSLDSLPALEHKSEKKLHLQRLQLVLLDLHQQHKLTPQLTRIQNQFWKISSIMS